MTEQTLENEIKNEVVAAYNEVLNKLKVVKNTPREENELTDDLYDDECMESLQEVEVKIEEQRVLHTAAQETSGDFVKNISDLKWSINKTLDEIKSKLLPEYEKFEMLRKAIDLSKQELEELNGIRFQADTLSALILAHKDKIAAFDQEVMEYRQTFSNEKALNERNRQVEENDYISKRDLIRKKNQDQYELTKNELEQELHLRREAFEEEMALREEKLQAREQEHLQLKEREAWITAREQEFQQLKEKVARFPDELRNTIQKTERAVIDQLTRKSEYDAKLMQIELESERKLYQQKINALEEQIGQYKMLKQSFDSTQF